VVGFIGDECVDNGAENKHINGHPLMPRPVFILLVFLAGAVRLRAQGEEWRPTAEIGYASRQVWRGVERAGDSVETALAVARGGFRGEVRLAEPFAGGEPGEVEARAGYGFQPGNPLTFEASVSQFFFSDVPPGATRRSTEAGLRAAWTLREGIAPSLAYYHDFRLRADTVEAALDHEVPLPRLGAFLELRFYAGASRAKDVRPDAPGPRRRDSYRYWGATARLPYRVGEHTTWVLGVQLAGSENQSRFWSPVGQGSGTRGGVNLAVSFDF
jgi:hypothetical protein